MQTFVVLYDIFNMKRLGKVKKIAYSYALGGQKSAVEAPLNKSLTHTLLQELTKVLKKEDKVNIISVSKPIMLGKAKSIEFQNGMIVL